MASSKKKFIFGDYVIGADPEKTRELYAPRPPQLFKCSCPGCQNFFKSISPYSDVLSETLEFLGVDWKRPDDITVVHCQSNTLYYSVTYSAFGRCLKSPKLYEIQKNELGTINVQNPDSIYNINSRLGLTFRRSGKGKITLCLTARLPWEMETLACIYDEDRTKVEKPVPGRARRIFTAVKKTVEVIKK